MRFVSTLVFALSITGLAAAALAQGNPASSGANVSGSASHSPQAATAGASGSDQPLTATGLDLNGPPIRFAPGHTPE